ncbi:MAG: DUF4179 domain-containing protein [Paraclostridium sp.]
MDNFDKKIKQIAQDEEWKIPESIDNNITNILNDVEHKSVTKARPFKVAILVATISALTITSAFAIEYIIKYFDYNKQSLYESDKNDLEKTGTDINLTAKDKGIELTIDSISIDDNYITIFQTVKSDKNIKEIYEVNEDAYFENPILSAYIDGKSIVPSGMIEHEATYTSDYELKGMRKIDVSNVDIKDNAEIEFKINEIFNVEGNWSINTKIDKSKSLEETHKYNINKDYTINNTFNYNGEKIDIKHKINIGKITISPLASKIVIKEKQTKTIANGEIMLGNGFALFDEKGNSLDIIDKGFTGYNPVTKLATNSIEFIKASKDTKSLTLVPRSGKEVENKMLEPQEISKFPLTFEVSEYGKLVVEDIKITDKEIEYTYYKDGVVPGSPWFWFYDEDGNEVSVDSNIKESLDRGTGRYTTILNLEGYNNDISQIRKINQISTFSQDDLKLLYDQQIKIDLVK